MAILPLGILFILGLVLILGGMGLTAVWQQSTPGRKAGVACLLVAALVIAGLLVLNAVRNGGHQTPPSIIAVHNLKQIGLGVLIYADDNDDCLPPSLGLIYPYVGDGHVFLASRESATPQPTSGADVDAGQCDFIYLGAGMKATEATNPGEVIVVKTKPSLPYFCVLYLDGHVEMNPATPAPPPSSGEAQEAPPVPEEREASEN